MQTETPLTYAAPVDFELFSAADAAKEIACHPSSVKRLAAELRLAVIRSRGGIHLFTGPQVSAIRAELERRRIEALR